MYFENSAFEGSFSFHFLKGFTIKAAKSITAPKGQSQPQNILPKSKAAMIKRAHKPSPKKR
jgi:hypothetical protein